MRHLIIFTFLISFLSYGQDPSYFILGENQLEGVNIYDITQDKAGVYWFATDQGLYKHDGYSYLKVGHELMKASSLFNFVKDSDGNIYCHNFSHQFFKIAEGQLELFYEIEKTDQFSAYSIQVNKEDQLIILGKSILIIDSKGNLVYRYKNKGITVRNSRISILQDGKAFTYNDQFHLFFKQSNNTFKLTEVDIIGAPSDLNTELLHLNWVNHNGQYFAVDRFTLSAFEFIPQKNQLKYLKTLTCDMNQQVLRIYSVGEQIWIAGQTLGTYAFDSHFNPISDDKLYKNYFISDIYQDHEGNYLLGTFNNGILVVSSLNALSYNETEQLKVTQLTAGNNTDIFCGTSKGETFKIEANKITRINQLESENTIEHLSYWKERNAFITNQQNGLIITHIDDKKSIKVKTGALKDVSFVDQQRVYLAQNYGVLLGEFKNETFNLSSPLIRDRSYSVEYDKSDQLLYVGTASGLKTIDKRGAVNYLKFHNQVIYANKLQRYKHYIVAGTKRYGLIFIDQGVVSHTIPVDGQIIKFRIQDNYIFIHSRNGFFIYNLEGDLIQKLSRSNGLSSDKIVDFELSKHHLVIANKNGLQRIEFSQLLEKMTEIPVSINWMKVNGKMNISQSLDYNQRRIEFSFSVNTLKYRDNLKYLIKLEGHDQDWQALDYQDNSITYNALPAGEYTFLVKSRNNDIESEVQQFNFTISAPFYVKWWFYLSLTILTVSLVIIFYRQRLKAQQKRAQRQNELNTSKLTAIQSQMNPHFIFNSLNSIQDLVIQGDAENSYTFITKFANLVRKTLKYSDKEYIEFEQEIELLKLYLTLEKLRFKEDFDYSISSHEISDILIPPMLIQPFIENALIHGLLHKEGHRQLTIQFELREHLVCTIQDNGIGREKAKEIKERQRGSHESFAVKGIKKRLDILKDRFGENIGFEYEDVIRENKVEGTIVTIQIPVKRTL